MNTLLEKIRKNSTIKEADVLSASKFFLEKDMITTPIPALNIALSGSLDGGFVPGITLWCGPSKMGKSFFSLLMAKAYMDKYPDAVCIFADCEFGIPTHYFVKLGIDMDRVVHVPIMNIEEFKFYIMKQLDGLTRNDRVVFIVDSLGNMASVKSQNDAIEGKDKTDMTRAKELRSIFRMITPYLNKLNIPFIAVNHVYLEQGAMYPKAIVAGGQGIYLSSDTIFLMGRQQEKDGTEVTGYNFIINVEKSRYVREKSKVPINVMFEKGISKYSGLIDIALESGDVIKPSMGWYSRVNPNTGIAEDRKWRMKDTGTAEFWDEILNSTKFQNWIKHRYQVTSNTIVSDEQIMEELVSLDD